MSKVIGKHGDYKGTFLIGGMLRLLCDNNKSLSLLPYEINFIALYKP